MATEVHGLVLGFDFAFLVPYLLEEVVGRAVMIKAYVDSQTRFKVVAKVVGTA